MIGYSRRGAYGSVAGTRAEADTASGDLNALADHLGHLLPRRRPGRRGGLEPTLVGNERTVPFTPDSGPYTLADKPAQAGVELTRDQVDQVLLRARELMAKWERLLSDEELAELAREAR